MTRTSISVCLLLAAMCGMASMPTAAEDDILGVPLKPDPPFAVDGDLSEWADVPGAMSLSEPAQVVWGAGTWQSPDDLSAVVQVAWRDDNLFVAVDVTDDVVTQSQRGANLWKGDHIEVYVDIQPEVEPDRTTFGAGQFHFAFSPGNFRTTGDPLVDCRPEVFRFRPEVGDVPGAVVAALRTPMGYTIEAAFPWPAMGIERARQDTLLAIEVGVSDTDSPEPQQECLMTTSTAEWGHTRGRLRLAVLASSDGKAASPVHTLPILDAVSLDHGASRNVRFEAPAVPEGRDAVLTLHARLNTPQVAGFHAALRVTLNGSALASDRVVNKPLRAKARDGRVFTLAAGDRLATYYAPDFDSPDRHPSYGLVDGYQACLFELRVNDLLREGENLLLIENAADESIERVLEVADVALAFRVPPPPPRAKAGPPVGPLAVFEPRRELRTDYTVEELAEGGLEIRVGDERFEVRSRYSTPAPGWVTGTCAYFRHERRVEPSPEAIIVRDSFENLTNAPLGIMHRHEVALGDRQRGLWLAGLDQPSGSGSTAVPANPTAFAATAEHGIGLVALDDVSRVHVTTYAVGGSLGVADNNLVLPPGGRHTASFAVVPVDAPDYWRFINAARRLTNANFRLDGAFAFFRGGPLTEAWSDKSFVDFLRFKDALWSCNSIMYPSYEGEYTHGTAFQRVDRSSYARMGERLERLTPDVQYLVYFHCFLDVTEDAPERFADARTLRPDGVQADYGKPRQRLFFPTETNAYGVEIAKNVDLILDEIGADGVYWDEHEYSRWAYHFGEPWDGCSGDIDPQTMAVTRLKSSVTLLSEAWRVALAKRIQTRGPLVGNGAPFTHAMRALQFPCFIETGSITNCTRGHLYSPIALGDHLTERSELDAYRVMLAALDYGCVYHWYGDQTVIPTHHHLTQYMYPITPLELHEGYIIGEERIVAKRSGLFGWGDASHHEVHVFDDTGCEVAGFDAPRVERDGKAYTELRLAEDWSAAILRVAGP